MRRLPIAGQAEPDAVRVAVRRSMPHTRLTTVCLSQDNSPYIARVLAGDTNFASFFLVRCRDGGYTTKNKTPCSDDAPALNSTISVVTQNGISRTVQHSANALVHVAHPLSLLSSSLRSSRSLTRSLSPDVQCVLGVDRSARVAVPVDQLQVRPAEHGRLLPDADHHRPDQLRAADAVAHERLRRRLLQRQRRQPAAALPRQYAFVLLLLGTGH